MGGIVSTGKSNEDLINNLVQVDYIKSPATEIAFRVVDRAEYFLPENRENAYQDAAWKCGHLHISAPCIYSEVIEGLCLEPGLSFLNLGSGTGYLSTVVGIILGSNGINHGIEYHEDVVQYAYKKLEDFKKHSGAIDEFDFCEPVFARANCLCLTENRLYDRVYCGAACPLEYEQYLKNLIKIGGILVVPMGESLMQYKRISESQWESKSLLPVSFTNLLVETEETRDLAGLFEIQPQSLQALSRNLIRSILRRNIGKELPDTAVKRTLKDRTFREALEKKRLMKRFVLPVLEDSSDDDLPGGGWWELNRGNNLLGHLFEALKNRNRRHMNVNNLLQHCNDPMVRAYGIPPMDDDDDVRRPTSSRNRNQEHQGSHSDEADSDGGVVLDSEREPAEIDEEVSENQNATSASMVANDGSVCSSISYQDHKRQSTLNSSSWADSSESEATSSNQSRSTYDRKKMDSGIGDENEILEASDSEMAENETEHTNEFNGFRDRSDDDRSRSAKRSSRQGGSRSVKWRRVASEPNLSSDSESDDNNENMNEMRMYKSRYTEPMRKKIQELPLPQILKNYINYHRDF